MKNKLLIGTRESQLAVWQATEVKRLLSLKGFGSELVYISSEGDVDLKTPLYEMGVQGVFTRTLDVALLNGKIDIAVHSMKDVPTALPIGLMQAAVLERASHKDIMVFKSNTSFLEQTNSIASIATSSIRRKSQWLNRYPYHTILNIRGNVNTRLQKLYSMECNAAIFAAAGLERISIRPKNAIDLNWMLPAPAQGAIMVVAEINNRFALEACSQINHYATAICTKIERDFLRSLLGGCSTPISALAEINNNHIYFKGNILTLDGKEKVEIELNEHIDTISNDFGTNAALKLLENGGKEIAEKIRNEGK